MSVNSKMTAIADAIRAKSGKTGLLTLDAMADEIGNLSAEEIIQHADMPDYIKPEVLRVANLVQSVRKDDSIVFLAMSDNHHYGAQKDTEAYTDASGIQTTTSNLHAAMAAKALAYVLNFDFMAQLGDATWGSKTTSYDILRLQADELAKFLREPHKGIPCFHAIGNHDTNIYRYNAITDGTVTSDIPAADEVATGEWLYNNFTALSASDDTVFGDPTYGGYCYRDFADKKLRVFLLNTSEMLTKTQADDVMSGAQTEWFRDALLELNTKSDAANWGFIVLCHYPADYGGAMFLSRLLRAYVEGAAASITTNETGYGAIACDFSGKNNAKFIAQFHGHVHNFLASRLWTYTGGVGSQYDGWRICIPNGQYDRENYYNTVGSYTDIVFKQNVSYPKTKNTAEETSFVINVINPSDKLIYSFCYGAGEKERIISYGDLVYHKINYSLSGVTLSNAATSIESGKSYAATITPNEHCGIDSVTVVMGTTDITSSVYANGAINIPEVTDNITITIKASVKLACTNQIPISTDTDGTVFNDTGWQINKNLSSSGVVQDRTGSDVTGFIPIKYNDVVRLKNVHYEKVASGALTPQNQRIAFYDASKNFLGLIVGSNAYHQNRKFNDAGHLIEFTVLNIDDIDLTNVAFFRINAVYIGSDSIITVNEEIIYADELENRCSITNSLNKIMSSNTTDVIMKGESYTATLTPYGGYVIDTITVTMNGIDVTANVYTDGVITIDSVTGDIVITATAVSTTTYTNLLPTSTDTDGTIYNGTGFKADTYLSSGIPGTRTGVYTSGFIPIDGVQTIYFKNCGIGQNQSNHRIAFYDETKTLVPSSQANTTQLAAMSSVTMIWGDNGNLSEFKRNDIYGRKAKFFRFCSGYLGTDSIVTVEEPIE